MNIKEYISSGILESYVLGELPSEERLEVEKNLALYQELREELSLIEQAQEDLLMKIAVHPRASVKAKVFGHIQGQSASNVIDMQADRSSRFWKIAAAASISVAIVSCLFAFHYWNKWRSSEGDLVALREQNSRIAEDYNRVHQKLGDFEKELEVIGDPSFSTVLMSGTANSPDASALVYWNATTSEVYLKVKNLKSLASGNQYQLWAIIDGKPVDAGVFDIGISGVIKMKDIGEGAAAFAVTIEPRGGKPSPSLETMQVLGNVKKS